MEVVAMILAVCYVVWMIFLHRGFRAYAGQIATQAAPPLPISIVVPFRNEEANLPALFQSLVELEYAPDKLEVLFVDDGSTDHSVSFLQNITATAPFAVQVLASHETGKKAAQSLGVAHANFDIIACTDADCRVSKNWLEEISNSLTATNAALVFGPVALAGSGHTLQKLEFASLISSTLAMLQLGWPVMGNAANMAFTKADYMAASHHLGSIKAAGGDDVFLLHHLARQGKKVAVHEAQVATTAQATLSEFLHQRLRWASKASQYRQRHTLAVGTLVFAVNSFLLVMMALLVLGHTMPTALRLLVIAKLFADFSFLRLSGKTLGHEVKPLPFLAQEFLNIFYVPLVGLAAQFLPHRWKGRQYRG